MPPPPATTNRRWTPAVAVALVLSLVGLTASGSMLLAHVIRNAVPNHALLNIPNFGPTASPPGPLPSPSGGPSPPSDSSFASLLAVLSATPQTPNVTIDPALALRIVETMWPVREEALDTDDGASLAGFETGSALQGDTADLLARACGCNDYTARTIATHDLFVPRQMAYPAWFLAELTTGPIDVTSSDVSLMVFTRASAATHWMLSLETGYSIGAPTAWVYATPETATGGFDPPSPTHNKLPADLAAYYQHWATDGTAPTSRFAPGVFTSAVGQTQVATDKTYAAEGLVHRVVYSVDLTTDGVWSAAANNDRDQTPYGWTLTCGTERYVSTTTLAKGAAPIVQPPDFSTWGSTLPPGLYTSVTQWGLHESCFMDDPWGNPYIVLGHGGGVTRSTGVPTVTG
jgi:hypothetical protein